MKRFMEWLVGKTPVERLLLAATVVAALRMMLIHAVFIGFDLETWPWFKAVEVGSGLAFAVLEGKALAYVSRLWVGLRPARWTEWVYWSVLALGQVVLLGSIIGVTAYAAASVRSGVEIGALIGEGQAVAWSMFVAALNPLMVVLIGIARAIDPSEQQAEDRPVWPPVEDQLNLFLDRWQGEPLTPDELVRQFERVTKIRIAIRKASELLVRRNLAQLSARVSEPDAGEGESSPDETITIRTSADEPASEPLSTEARRKRVREMQAQGMSQAAMARELGVHASTVKRDVEALRAEAEMVRGNGKVRG